MLLLHVSLDALGTKLSSIKWKVLPRLEADDLVFLGAKLNVALLSTKAAVRLYQTVVFSRIGPSTWRYKMRRRAKLFHEI